MSKSEIEATEAHAFLNVVAPKLERLRRRLAAANDQLKIADPEKGRLNAIVESQLALKEFLTSIPNLGALIDPIDIVLDAVRDDAESEAPADTRSVEPREPAEGDAQAPQIPVPDLMAPPPPPALASPPLAPAGADKSDRAPGDLWLRVGTAIAVEKLVNAGMPAANAEAYVGEVYASIGLSQRDGSAISQDTIHAWRNTFIGTGAGGWRRKVTPKRRVGTAASGMGANSLIDVKGRVDEIAVMFKKMTQLAATRARS